MGLGTLMQGCLGPGLPLLSTSFRGLPVPVRRGSLRDLDTTGRGSGAHRTKARSRGQSSVSPSGTSHNSQAPQAGRCPRASGRLRAPGQGRGLWCPAGGAEGAPGRRCCLPPSSPPLPLLLFFFLLILLRGAPGVQGSGTEAPPHRRVAPRGGGGITTAVKWPQEKSCALCAPCVPPWAPRFTFVLVWCTSGVLERLEQVSGESVLSAVTERSPSGAL